MVYRPRRSCRRCGVDRARAGGVSRSGLCRTCGPIVQAEALEQIAHRHGEHYQAWLDGLTAAVARLWGATLTPDTLLELDAQTEPEEAQGWLAGLRD